MEDSQQTHIPNQPPRNTDLAQVKSSVGERMRNVIGSDLRLDLLKKMKKTGLGCQGQESFLKMMNVGFKCKKKVNTKERLSYLALTTEIKIQDAIKDLARKKTMLKKEKKKMERVLGKNTNKMRNTMKNLSKECKDYKERIKTKYKKKIEHLEKKHGEEIKTKIEIPDSLTDYENLAIFKKTEDISNKIEDLHRRTEIKNKEETEEKKDDIKKKNPSKVMIINLQGEEQNLTPEELEVISLPPGQAIYEDLDKIAMEEELAIMSTKWRWEMRQRKEAAEDSQIDENETPTPEELEMMEQLEAESRLAYNGVEGSLSLSKHRVTDLPNNSRVILPKAMSPLEEARIAVRVAEYRRKFDEYKRENCTKKGKQKSNLTPSQQKGLESLKRRVRKGEIQVLKTDKTGKLVITNRETYIKMGEAHTAGDIKVDDQAIKATQNTINGHISMIMKSFKVGEQWGQEKRMRETTINNSEEVAPMYLVIKDHKYIPPGDLPKTRPIVTGCQSMARHLAGFLSDIVEALADCMEDPLEAISTEDMLAVVEEYSCLYFN